MILHGSIAFLLLEFSLVMASHEVGIGQFIYMLLLHVNTTCGCVVMRLGLSAPYLVESLWRWQFNISTSGLSECVSIAWMRQLVHFHSLSSVSWLQLMKATCVFSALFDDVLRYVMLLFVGISKRFAGFARTCWIGLMVRSFATNFEVRVIRIYFLRLACLQILVHLRRSCANN